MDARLDILRAFEREPNKTFSTTRLVEVIFPREMNSLHESFRLASKEQRRTGQLLKSKLHRKTLYYLSKLVQERHLEIVRIDAHGEKQYRLVAPQLTVYSKSGLVQVHNQTMRTHFIEDELERNAALIFEEQSVLSRCNSLLIDCTKVDGFGHLSKLLDKALHEVNDVVCCSDFQALLGKYRSEHVQEFLEMVSMQTLDEGKVVCLLLDTRKEPIADFVRLYVSQLPKRIFIVFVCDGKSILSEPFLASLGYLQERSEKVNVHFCDTHPYPLFVGHAGVYGFQKEDWECFTASQHCVAVVSQVSIFLDLERLSCQPAHEIRAAIVNAAKTIYALANQQRLQLSNIGAEVSGVMASRDLLCGAHTYLRFWNYDWEKQSRIVASVQDELSQLSRLQNAVYRACNLPSHTRIQLSSTFGKADRRLSARSYRKWMVTQSADLQTDAFRRFLRERLHYLELFSNIDRLRIFRAGNPTPHQVAQELLELGKQGFPLVTIDFKPLRGVRRLTEYFT